MEIHISNPIPRVCTAEVQRPGAVPAQEAAGVVPGPGWLPGRAETPLQPALRPLPLSAAPAPARAEAAPATRRRPRRRAARDAPGARQRRRVGGSHGAPRHRGAEDDCQVTEDPCYCAGGSRSPG